MLLMAPLRTGDNEMAMLLDIRKGEFDRKRFNAIPKPLRSVLNHALEVERDDRFSTALEFAEALESKYDENSKPMSEAEVATFMHSLFAEDIEREKVRDEEVERELRKTSEEDEEAPQPIATTPRAPAGSLKNPLNIFAARGAGPVAVPAVDAMDQRPLKATREGLLHEISLCRVLHQITDGTVTGVLDLHRDPVKKSIDFENGNPVFADSNIESELFGEHLVAQGILSREQHGETLDFAARKGLRFTEALLALNACTPNVLFQQLGGQVRNRILDLFSWITGSYFLYVDAPITQSGLPLNLRTHTLIHEGVQERLPLVVIRRFMEGRMPQKVLRVPGSIPADLQLSGRQQRILRTIEAEETTVAELVRREKDEEWLLRLLFMLHEIQRVVFRD